MENLTIIKKLDTVLEVIRNNNAEPIREGKLITELSLRYKTNLTPTQLTALLTKLIKDDYIHKDGEDAYYVSVEGYLYLETIGGYAANDIIRRNELEAAEELKKHQVYFDEAVINNSIRLNTLTRWLVIVTVFLSLITACQLIVAYFQYRQTITLHP